MALSSGPPLGLWTEAAGSHEFAAQDRDGLPSEKDAIALDLHAHHATPRRGLIGNELVFAHSLFPEGPKATVRGASDRVRVDARSGREEARDKIKSRCGCHAGDDDATNWQGGKQCEIRFQGADYRRVNTAGYHMEPSTGLLPVWPGDVIAFDPKAQID